MYLIELALKLSPLPLSVQRKKLEDAKALYNQLKESLKKGDPRLLEISCEQVEDKKIAVLVSEVLAVQMYEKTAGAGGNRRPGFSFDE
ncbi:MULTISPECIES: hypothetical protein [Prochlorococcus]|uniref:UPF0367 protein Pro_0144 n=1 Tax=Prochlorococcus marinus (strain SARG / CCMP1375 / SS120) TaxID=167539 RepID=Y144_PROMA|nr:MULTISPECIES: hypothetical protein [Prochlorococcus]Q7VE69.1 RecName: Full=UPF0367 protein Pro_0144 [Prochlorococcus marinus subsp. marinus str. CCMP1375]AAP99190.1 Uncharacterized protein Pro_0144 [Prochlorococcus marinus subsp. marinus str. CCMP1375]